MNGFDLMTDVEIREAKYLAELTESYSSCDSVRVLLAAALIEARRTDSKYSAAMIQASWVSVFESVVRIDSTTPGTDAEPE